MGQLIDELLRFCRTGRAELRHQRTELCQVLERALGEIAEETNGRKITWRKNALPAVWADPVLLRQVFINLLANAVKYTRPRAEAVIEIGCLEDTPNETVIFVRDNGVGFDMRYADKLFGIFQRLHANEDFEGSGIGLANVRRIIARHGGRTWADAKVDGGATLYFSLPKANHETAHVDSQNHFVC
jgi:light-regulated signal transduction histidine kinase (bacteriophytochrome)